MKKGYILGLMLFCLLYSSSLFAFDWETYNITVKSTEQRGRYKILTLVDKDLNQFKLTYKDRLNKDLVVKAIDGKNKFYKWSSLKIKALRCILDKKIVQFVIIPDSIKYKNEDLSAYMPAGMVFFYNKFLTFNFRMVKENVSMKIKGRFINLPEFLLYLANAIDNPLAFASKSNYMARLDRLDKQLEDLKIKHFVLLKSFNDLRYAVMKIHNTGFLRGPRGISQKLIVKVLSLKTKYDKEYKRKNKVLSNKEFKKILKKNGVKISSKEFKLIMYVYYPAYKK